MSNNFLFTSAALFNWIIAIGLSAMPVFVYKYLLNGTAPDNFVMLYLFAGLVFTFGVGYFWISRDFAANIQIVKLGIIGKMLVFTLVVLMFFMGLSKPLLVALASGDLLYSGLFWRALKNQRMQKT